MNRELAIAAGLGLMTGLRSMTPLAGVARALVARRASRRRTRTFESGSVDARAADVALLMALGEIVADKLPGMPSRTNAAPLFARIAIGAFVGATAARHARSAGGALGAATALLGSHCGAAVRGRAGRDRLPAFAVALLEDAAAIGTTALLARAFREDQERG